MKNKVIVFGNDHHNTLGLCRSIGELRLDLCLVLWGDPTQKFFCAKSKYVKQLKIVSNETELLDFFVEHTELYNSVVFTTGDYYASLLFKNYSVLKDKYILGVKEDFAENFEKFQDKVYIGELAEKLGLRTPREITLDFQQDIKNQVIAFELPLFLKANSSAIGGKEFTKKFSNYEDCISFLERNSDATIAVQIQEYIQKDLEISFLGVAVPGGEVIIPGVIKKIREFPIGFGSSSFAVLDPNSKQFIDDSILKEFVRSLGYMGLFSIEFLVKGDQLFFLEINLRNDGNGYVTTKGGVNLVGHYVKYFYKNIKDKNVESHYVNRKIYFMNEVGDLKYTIATRRNIIKWFKDIRNTDCFLLFNRRDKKPFFYKFFYQFFKR